MRGLGPDVVLMCGWLAPVMLEEFCICGQYLKIRGL